MIPQNPNWSDIRDGAPFLSLTDKIIPAALGRVSATSLGGVGLSDNSKGLAYNWWHVYQKDSGQVVILRQDNGQWVDEVTLFTEGNTINTISLCFDQLGRPSVFYTININDLKLFWYDPQQQSQVVSFIGKGTSPHLVFDYPLRPSDPNSDIVMFYVDDVNYELIMKLQRDRWGVDYPTGIKGRDLVVFRAGIDVRNRLQLEFRGEDSD